MSAILQSLTSNQYYGGQNRRFDRRAKQLRKFGFRYERIAELDFAVFVRPQRFNPNRKQAIPTAFLFVADNRAWNGKLEEFLRR